MFKLCFYSLFPHSLQPCVDLTEMRVRMPVVPQPVFNVANVHLLVQSDDGDSLQLCCH